MTRPKLSLWTPLLFTALLSGCSPERRGHLVGDESELRASGPGLRSRFYPVDNPERYYRFVIDPIEIVPAPGLTMDQELAERIADHYRRELVARLADRYEVLDHGGAGVMRLRVAIVGLRPGPGHGLPNARMEATVSDSVTDRLILAVQDRRSHSEGMNRSLVSEWENAKGVLQVWAAVVRLEVARLDP